MRKIREGSKQPVSTPANGFSAFFLHIFCLYSRFDLWYTILSEAVPRGR